MKTFASFPFDIHYSLGFINSFLASGDFYYLLIAFANSLDPGQCRQNVGPDLNKDCLPPSDTIHVYGLGAKLIYMDYFASLLHTPGKKLGYYFQLGACLWA